VFDTDVLRRLLTAAEEATGATYGREEESDVSLRILADHARSVTFLIHDGITPSNEERGYVLRRIIRRAVRHAQRAGATKPTLTLMAAAVAEVMRAGYPELEQSLPRINDALEREESRFVDRLSVGLSLLDQAIVPGTTTISGETAFQLHDTHGFPVELTAEIAAERGLTVDLETFEAEMRRQQELARNAARNTAADDDLSHVRELQEAVGDSRFVGYEQTESDGTVLALELTGENGTGDLYVDVTPFYAESGGQVGDTGTVRTATGVAKVTNTTSPLPGIVRHTIEIEDGLLETGQSAELEVDQRRRNSLRRSHTATHLLHWALRQVLGAQTHQHGSLVAPDALRFDFNHHSPLTAEELHRLEDLVTEQIMTDGSVTTTEMPLAEAKAEGAMSFFGEKYGERVRVVRAGEHSIELCGGTHVTSLGRIGPFIIRSESSVGANLRRIEALVGLEASAAVRRERELLRAVATRLRTVPDEAIDALERIEQGAAEAQRELRRLRAELDRDAASDLAAAAADGVVVQRVDRRDGDALRALAETVRDKPGISAVGLVGSPDGTAVAIAVALNAHPAQAPAVAREAAKAVGGGAGGSNPRTAVGGGRDAGKIDVALQVLRDALAVS
jgi:alanyl-tRNA synthetase